MGAGDATPVFEKVNATKGVDRGRTDLELALKLTQRRVFRPLQTRRPRGSCEDPPPTFVNFRGGELAARSELGLPVATLAVAEDLVHRAVAQ